MTAAVLSFRKSVGRLDGPLTAIVAVFCALFVLTPTQAADSAAFAGRALLEVVPFLLLSVAIAAYAKASGAESLNGRAFSGNPSVMIRPQH